MNTHEFVRLSTSVCRELRSWVDEARRHAVVSDGELLALSDAAEVIDRATRALVANQPDTETHLAAETASNNPGLVGQAADAADEAGSALLPHDKVLSDPASQR